MLPISAAALAALPGAIRRPYYAQWTADGGVTWTDARVAAGSGSITADRTAEVRYQASATLVGVPVGRAGINTVSTEVRLWQGVQAPRSGPEWIPAGRYTVTGVAQTRTGVELELDGLEDVLRGAQFVASRVVGPDSARALVESLVAEALPGIPVAWQAGVAPDTTVPRILADADRWAVLSAAGDSDATGIAQALAGEIWVDARGVVVVGPVPTLDDAPVWTVARGAGGALIEPTPKQSSEGLYNVISVTGDAGTGTATIGPAYAWDDDPSSLTYAGPDPVGDPLAPQRLGLYGVRPRVKRVTSSLVTTEAQASDMARAQLADALGIQVSLSFTAVCNPALEAGDVVLVETEPGVWERHLVDSLSWDLGAASMSCTTRTTTRRT